MTFQECSCPYCARNKWPILWEFSKTKNSRFEYFWEVPKNGSGGFKKDAHNKRIVPQSEWNELADIKPYFFYRHPVNRMSSLLKHYFHESGQRWKKENSFFINTNRKGLIFRIDANLLLTICRILIQ